MKKTLFTFLVMLMSIVCVFVLMGCPSPENPADPVTPPEPVRQTVSDKIGRYGTPYEVGDIVFTDGSATPAADIESRADVDSVTGTKLTAVEKNALVAYIFYVGNELNNGNDTATRTLGVGFEVSPYTNAWIHFGVPDYSIDSLTCSVTGTSGAYSFSGIKNGRGKLDDAFNAYRAYSELLVEETKTKIEEMLLNVNTYLERANIIAAGNEAASTYLSSISEYIGYIDVAKDSLDANVNTSGPIVIDPLESIKANFCDIDSAFSSAADKFDSESESESEVRYWLYSYSNEVSDYWEELSSIHLFSIKRNDFVAFVKAEEYGSDFSSYSDGWYLPTIAELYEVWKKKDDLYAIMGEEYDYDGKVVSATQAADAGNCDLLNFSSGEISSGSKTSGNDYAAFAIREFPAE